MENTVHYSEMDFLRHYDQPQETPEIEEHLRNCMRCAAQSREAVRRFVEARIKAQREVDERDASEFMRPTGIKIKIHN